MVPLDRTPVIPIGPSIAYVPLTQKQHALIDSWRAAQVGKHKWYAYYNPRTDRYYAVRHDGSTSIYLHQAISPDHAMVDHKNRRSLDDRECNLRPTNAAGNQANRGPQKRNTSGFKGVSFRKDRNCWRAFIGTSGRKYLHLGVYKTAEEAARAYDLKAIELHGDFACTNF